MKLDEHGNRVPEVMVNIDWSKFPKPQPAPARLMWNDNKLVMQRQEGSSLWIIGRVDKMDDTTYLSIAGHGETKAGNWSWRASSMARGIFGNGTEETEAAALAECRRWFVDHGVVSADVLGVIVMSPDVWFDVKEVG